LLALFYKKAALFLSSPAVFDPNQGPAAEIPAKIYSDAAAAALPDAPFNRSIIPRLRA
jgi:hypothetical protein